MNFQSFIKLSRDGYMDFLISNNRPYWQKYVKGINMSVIDCDPTQQNNCTLELEENKLYTAISSNDVCDSCDSCINIRVQSVKTVF